MCGAVLFYDNVLPSLDCCFFSIKLECLKSHIKINEVAIANVDIRRLLIVIISFPPTAYTKKNCYDI